MCSRFSRTYQIELAAKWRKIRDPRNILKKLSPQYNIAPTDEALVIVQTEGEPHYDLMTFGLIPHWAKDPKIALSCLNARSETIAEKPAFRESLKKRRCLVVADGFYEWKHEGKAKSPHRVVLRNHEPFAFAGLWDSWKRPDGKQLSTFSIITTVPNELLSPIHDRMPVILNSEDENLWLAPYVTEPKTVLPLLKPYPAEALHVYQVSPYVSNSANKGHECVEGISIN